jgi:PAS domain S-box-containing protein
VLETLVRPHMVMLVEVVVWGVLLAVGVGFVGLGVWTYRDEEFPGRASFTAYCLLLGLTVVAVTGLSVAVSAKNQPGAAAVFGLLESLFRVAAFLFGLAAPVAWLRFVFAYTGHRIPTDRRTLLAFGAPVLAALGAILALLAVVVTATLIGPPQVPDVVEVVVFESVTYLLPVTAFYILALLVAGTALVAWTSHTYSHLSDRGGTLLAVGCVLPWAAAAVPYLSGLFGGQNIQFAAHVAAGGSIGLAAVVVAVATEDVFEKVPAAGTVGRDVTVETMNDPMVVVDGAHRIVDLNPAAERLFGASEDAIGGQLSALVDAPVTTGRLLEADRTEFELDGGNRVLEARGSVLEDEYGRSLGHSVVFHDITDRTRRQQRIQVLNRVLRHNLRNDMAVVNGHAEALAATEFDLGDHPDQIRDTADGLLAIGQKAGEIQHVVASKGGGRTALSTVLEEAVADVEADHPGCTFRVAGPDVDTQVDGEVLGAVVRELGENAAVHNDADDPEVAVRATGGGDAPLEVTVTDNGPGIPEHELTPIRAGEETDLEHGSGLGLWLVEWGVAALDGRLSFEADDGGTRARVRLPAE